MLYGENILDQIIFKGLIVNGVGRHVELYVPGKLEILQAPEDWPDKLCSGSLNIRINPDGFPEEFMRYSINNKVEILDSGMFDPILIIKQDQFGNNMLVPNSEMLDRGTGQVWRATLHVNDRETRCWVLRRKGSRVGQQLEVVSHENIREKYGYDREKEWPAKLTLYGEWRST